MNSFKFVFAISMMIATTACSGSSAKKPGPNAPVTFAALPDGSIAPIQLNGLAPLAHFTPGTVGGGALGLTSKPLSGPVVVPPQALLVDISAALDVAVGGAAQRISMLANLSTYASVYVTIPFTYGANQNSSITVPFGEIVDSTHGIINRLLLKFPDGDTRGFIVIKLAGLPSNLNIFQSKDGSVIIHGLQAASPYHTYYFGRIDTFGTFIEVPSSAIRADVLTYSIVEFSATVSTAGWTTPATGFGAGDVVYTGYSAPNSSGIATKLNVVVIKANGNVVPVYNYVNHGPIYTANLNLIPHFSGSATVN